MSLALASFPVEILAEVTCYLHGFVLLRVLYLTGDKLLWQKFQLGGVRELRLNDHVRSERDILSLKSFRGLLSLEVKYPLTTESDDCLLIEQLPSTLTKLDLTSLHAEKGWRKEAPHEWTVMASNGPFQSNGYGMQNLSERLPRLKHLILRGSSWLQRWSPDKITTVGMLLLWLRCLPRGLETFHMSHLGELELPYLEQLPPHLKKLTREVNYGLSHQLIISALPSSLAESLGTYSVSLDVADSSIVPELPRSAHTLILGGFYSSFFNSPSCVIPPTLTSLTLTRGPGWQTLRVSDEMIEAVPATLRSFRCGSLSSHFNHDTRWPPHLTELDFGTSKSFDHFSNIPTTMIYLSIKTDKAVRLNSSAWRTFPCSQLLQLHLKGIACPSQECLSFIPRTITDLGLQIDFSNESISPGVWPSNLRTFHTYQRTYVEISPEFISSLPPSLTKFQASSSVEDICFATPPPSLTHVQLPSLRITGKLGIHFDPKLPYDHPTLVIPEVVYFSPFSISRSSHSSYVSNTTPNTTTLPSPILPFSKRPSLLHNADIPRSEIRLATQLHLSVIPPHITALKFYSQLQSDWRPLIAQMGNLTSLTARFSADLAFNVDFSSLTRLVSLKLISYVPTRLYERLPPNLTRLKVKNAQNWPISSFPSTLCLLECFSLSLEDWSQLTQLEHMKSMVGVPESLAHKLPGNLKTLSVNMLAMKAVPIVLNHLSHLTLLKGQFVLNEDAFDILLHEKRIILLKGSIGACLDRLERWVPYIECEKFGTIPLCDLMHSAVLKAYPYIEGLRSTKISVTFNFPFWRTTWAKFWPVGLTILRLGNCTVPARFGRALPPTLTTLEAIEVLGTTHYSSHDLPPSLTTLTFSARGFSLLSYQKLPRSITRLQLRKQRKFWPHHAKALPPALHHLTLDVCLTSHATIAALPRTIQELDFGYSATSIRGPALEHLPPNLVFLGGSLSNVDDQTYLKVFSRIPSIHVSYRHTTGEFQIKLALLRRLLEKNTFDQIASHLNLP